MTPEPEELVREFFSLVERHTVIEKSNYWTGKTLESWHTAITAESDNNSNPLPEPYRILLNKA